jgi:hypothetical protein
LRLNYQQQTLYEREFDKRNLSLYRKLLVSLFSSNESVMSFVFERCVSVEKMCH